MYSPPKKEQMEMLDRIEQKIVDIIESKKDEIIAFGQDIC